MTALQQALPETKKCNRCGYCQPPCPVFQATGVESSCGRGRIQLIRAAAEGRLEFSRDLGPVVFECLLCRACVEACAPRAETDLIVARARAEWFDRWGRSLATDLLFRELLADRRKLETAAELAFRGINWGFVRPAELLGLLRLQPRAAAALDWLGQPPRELLSRRLARMRLSPAGSRLRVGYFISCGVNMLAPDAGEAAVRLLSALGCEVVPLDNACCGLPAYVYGDREAARRLLESAAATFANAGSLDAVVTDCGSCSSHLRHAAELLGADDPALDVILELTRDLAEFVLDLGETPTHAVRARVTYHDPCHLSRHQTLTRPPRELMSRVDGLEYVEMRDANWCCGGAGSYGIDHTEIARVILERKMDTVDATGAGVLATACPACITQLALGTRRHRLQVNVVHVSEVLARAYGVDLPLLRSTRALETVDAP